MLQLTDLFFLYFVYLKGVEAGVMTGKFGGSSIDLHGLLLQFHGYYVFPEFLCSFYVPQQVHG